MHISAINSSNYNNSISMKGQRSHKAQEAACFRNDEQGFVYYTDYISNVNKAGIHNCSKKQDEMTLQLFSKVANALGKDDPEQIINSKDEILDIFQKKYEQIKKSGRKTQENDKDLWFLERTKSGDFLKYSRKGTPISVEVAYLKDNAPDNLRINNERNTEFLEVRFDDDRNIISGYKTINHCDPVYTIEKDPWE